MDDEAFQVIDLSDSDEGFLEHISTNPPIPTYSQSRSMLATGQKLDSEDSDPQSTTRSTSRLRDRNNASNIGGDKERQFLNTIFGKATKKKLRQKEYLVLEVDDFCVFKEGVPQLASLHAVSSHNHERSPIYSFSGKVNHKGISYDLKRLIISGVEIDNFGDFDEFDKPRTSSCNNAIYLQTTNTAAHNCYYLLRTPNEDYARLFADFQWLATFTKHVVDYCFWAGDKNQEVRLKNFEKSFGEKIADWHHSDTDYQNWRRACGDVQDFRRHISCATHAQFVYDQVNSIEQGNNDSLLLHPLWEEIAPQNLRDTVSYDEISQHPTFVTAKVADCFLTTFPSWAQRTKKNEDLMQILQPAPEVKTWLNARCTELGLATKSDDDQLDNFEIHDNVRISTAALLLEKASREFRKPDCRLPARQLVGMAVIVRVENNYKFAYVQDMMDDGLRMRVKWLILPSQTICNGRKAGRIDGRQATFYPNGNELFWSVECNCDTIHTYRVITTHGISTNQSFAAPGHELFVHRQYDPKELAISEVVQQHAGLCDVHDVENIEDCTLSTTSSSQSVPQLAGQILSLFAGCGLLDRGFESAADGLFHTTFAVDCDHAALSSFQANHPDKEACEFENQDVNVLFKDFCRGIRRLPNIRLLLAGSPCQGFSLLNSNKDTDKARKNCSMLAHTIAWIDLLRPQMVCLENVKGMDPLGLKGGASAAGQSVSFLVSIGYQVRLAVIRASDYGGSTSRERLFIIATAPGIPLPQIPQATHGTDSNLYAPVCASAVTLDLTRIDNNSTFISSMHPDHVPFFQLDPVEHGIVSKIPPAILGRKSNLWSVQSRLASPAERNWYSRHSPEQKQPQASSWCRVNPNKPMGTIVTKIIPRCARSGTSLHWSEHRVCSLMEFRRFHGIPDHYILVGSKLQQIHQLGNSVAWVTSTILGRAYAGA